ncbi:unnamed protein product [Discosporangium mesarthrocarpum]
MEKQSARRVLALPPERRRACCHYVDIRGRLPLHRRLLGGDRAHAGTTAGQVQGPRPGDTGESVGLTIQVDETGTTLHQQRFAQSIVTDGMGSMEVRTASSPLYPGMDLTARRNDGEGLDTTRCPYANTLGKLTFLVGMTRPDLFQQREGARPPGGITLSAPLAWTPTSAALPRRNHEHRASLPEMTQQGPQAPPYRLCRFRLGKRLGDTPERHRISLTVQRIVHHLAVEASRGRHPLQLKGRVDGQAHGMRHCIFIRGILAMIGIRQAAMAWYGDKRGALQAAAITSFNGRTKHVDMKLKCMRKYIARDFFNVHFVPTTKQLADIFTKCLRRSATFGFIDSVLSNRV